MPSRPLHALVLPPGPQLLEAVAAAIDGGPAVLPLDPAASPAVRTRQLDQFRPHALVDGDGVHPLAGAADLDPDVAVVIGTSGSTGTPKGAQLSAAALLHSADATLARLDATPMQRWLCCLPTHNIAGIQVLVRSLVAGSTPEIAPFTLAALGASSADFVSVVPTMLYRALEAGVDLTRFQTILVGGDAMPLSLHKRATVAGARVVTTYGMSETGGGAVYDGVPLDGVRVAVDPDERIRLAGPVLASGYRLDPGLTATAFVDGWHVTQDAGQLGHDGRLHVLGRLDDIVISGGVNVSMVVVAAALTAHPSVAQAAAYARPDAEWGHRIVAVVVPRREPPTLDVLRSFVSAAAGAAAAPRELVLVEELPTLPGGKLDRNAIGRLLGGATNTPPDSRRPTSPPPRGDSPGPRPGSTSDS
ncbi:MAG: AMP-binding protein [Geodermatophilaceae bacterium]|nr:AMP-binding protein [Geodermatophilaceae bacterium]